MEGLIRDVEEKEAMRLLKQVLENNVILLKLQKQLLKLQVIENLLLLFFLPPSHMVVPKITLANISFLFDLSIQFNF